MSTVERQGQNSSGAANGAAPGGGSSNLGADARRVADDAASMVRDAKQVGDELRRIIKEKPLQAVGAAAGVGFVVGGGLSPAVLRSLGGLATRLAMVLLTRKVINLIDERDGLAGANHTDHEVSESED